ncbi:MAG: hypothetical protein H8K03_07030 [Nitrospira sp.]
MKTLRLCGQRIGSTWVVPFLCVCVALQIVDVPVTPLSLFNTSDMFTESDSEDPSVLPPVPEIRPLSALRLQVDGHAIPHLPVLLTSVFHPPLI